ncbi:hypothetical protein [Bauldia sp.]|uniref:hypothetical protein n=1 Tax=Bauldia sp. TaxID=2575872 RepID=UPI003BA9ABF1
MSPRSSLTSNPENRWTDRSLVLALAAFVLLTPPIILVFSTPVLVLGVPLLHVYCFGVWLIAIVAGAYLSTRLDPAERPSDDRVRPPPT